MPFQTPQQGICFSAGNRPCSGRCPRYERNIGHQAEIILPMLEEATVLRMAPTMLHWSFNLTHWSRELIRVVWPFTRVDTSPAPRRNCRVFRPIGSNGGRRGWLRVAAAAPLVRSAVLRHCGMVEDMTGVPTSESGRKRSVDQGAESERLAFAPGRQNISEVPTGAASRAEQDASDERAVAVNVHRQRIVVLLRGGAPGGEPRHFAHLDHLLQFLRAALPFHDLAVERAQPAAQLCEQAAWVAGASLVISPHGAHLLNALWMDTGATLIEVMPWGMWEYPGYQSLFQRSGLTYHRVNSSRPPADAPQWVDPDTGKEQFNELECYRDSSLRRYMKGSCRLFYRAESELVVPKGQMCDALRPLQIASLGGVPTVCK